MPRSAVSLVALAIALLPFVSGAQSGAVKWESTCVEQGCLVQADVLRGDSGSPPDTTDFHEYLTLEVALDRKSLKAEYFAFHVDANAQPNPGVAIAFTKKTAIDSDGTSRLAISDCDQKSCVARVPLGMVKKSEDSHNLNLLDKFLKADSLVLTYRKDAKEYRTAVPLASFKQEYQRLLSNELK